jgi:hypothetical protein
MYFARGTSDGALCESGIRNDAPGKVFAGGCLCGQRGDHGQDLFSEFGWVMPASLLASLIRERITFIIIPRMMKLLLYGWSQRMLDVFLNDLQPREYIRHQISFGIEPGIDELMAWFDFDPQ